MNPRICLSALGLVFVLALVFPLSGQQGQEETQLIRIELKYGSVVVGEILSEDETSIRFRTLSNVEMVIQKDQIKKREIISGKIVEGQVWEGDPNRTRLLFAPTGRALQAGQGYFSVYEIFFPFVAYGITDWLAISGGISLVPGLDTQALYISPKVTPLRLKNFDLSAGVLYARVPDDPKDEEAGIVYGVGTYGTDRAALTAGVGFAFTGEEFEEKPIFLVGGEIRTSKTIKLITENWIVPDSDVQFLSLGIRFFGSRIAADFALIYPAGADMTGFPFLPWIGFAYNFGPKK